MLARYQTANYILGVVKQDGKSMYQVQNKGTEVVEYEDFLLSRILDTLVEMQTRLDAAVEKFEGHAVPKPRLTLVPGGSGDGEGGVH